MSTIILLYLLVGILAGFLAGLFGLGGGVIVVPALVFAFTHQGMPVETLTHMAVGTSFAVICVSSVSSVRAHHKNGFVLWPVVGKMAPGLVLGVALGVFTVIHIPGQTLQWLIGAYLLLVALQMVTASASASERSLPDGKWLFSAGGVIGWVSALFGIGGGSLSVPFLSHFGARMQNAVATSAACGVPIAFAGAISNMVAGISRQGLPEWSLGYVYLPAFLGIALMSAPFAKLGAGLAKRLPSHLLKRLFALFLAIIGSSLILKATGIA